MYHSCGLIALSSVATIASPFPSGNQVADLIELQLRDVSCRIAPPGRSAAKTATLFSPREAAITIVFPSGDQDGLCQPLAMSLDGVKISCSFAPLASVAT